jgi:hypothetical protein
MQSINPYTGWRTNCYATSLGMILSQKGDTRPIPYIDCLTTLPFGPFIYSRLFQEVFYVESIPPRNI